MKPGDDASIARDFPEFDQAAARQRIADAGGDFVEGVDFAVEREPATCELPPAGKEWRDLIVPLRIADADLFVVTAKGLRKLGFPGLAETQERESRERLEAAGLLDSPAGAGADVEAERG